MTTVALLQLPKFAARTEHQLVAARANRVVLEVVGVQKHASFLALVLPIESGQAAPRDLRSTVSFEVLVVKAKSVRDLVCGLLGAVANAANFERKRKLPIDCGRHTCKFARVPETNRCQSNCWGNLGQSKVQCLESRACVCVL